jgi:hypothetical protein
MPTDYCGRFGAIKIDEHLYWYDTDLARHGLTEPGDLALLGAPDRMEGKTACFERDRLAKFLSSPEWQAIAKARYQAKTEAEAARVKREAEQAAERERVAAARWAARDPRDRRLRSDSYFNAEYGTFDCHRRSPRVPFSAESPVPGFRRSR